MENNEIEILVNDYCDLRDKQERTKSIIKYIKEELYIIKHKGIKEPDELKKYINRIRNVEYKLYQLGKKLYDIDEMYYNANAIFYRRYHNISKEKTDREILIEHYINIENDKKIINLIKDFTKLPLDIRYIIIKYIEKEKEDEDNEEHYYIFNFDKYKNESSKTVIENDANYIKWFVRNVDISYDSRKKIFKLLDENN